MGNRKVTLIGGGGVRTPLVIFGINESAAHLGVDEMVLYDLDQDRAHVMCQLGQALIAREGGTLRLRVATTLEDAIAGDAFVLTATGSAESKRVRSMNASPSKTAIPARRRRVPEASRWDCARPRSQSSMPVSLNVSAPTHG